MKCCRQSGIILILTVAVIFVIASVAAFLLAISISSSGRENARNLKLKSFEIAETGVDMALNSLRQATDGVDNDGDGTVDNAIHSDDLFNPSIVAAIEGCLGRIGTVSWTPSNDLNGDGMPDFGEPNVSPLAFSGGEVITYTIFSENDGIDNDADGATDESDEASCVSIIAKSAYGGVQSVLRYSGRFTEKLMPPDPPLWVPRAAMTAGWALDIKGHPSILGAFGNVHTNQNLAFHGHPTVAGNASAAGTISTGGGGGGGGGGPIIGGDILPGVEPADIPSVKPEMFRGTADFILASDGRIYRNGVEQPPSLDTGWTYTGGKWHFNGSGSRAEDFEEGTYFIEGDVQISGRVGSGGGHGGGGSVTSFEMTVIATGSIKMAGNSSISRDGSRTDYLLFVAGGDIDISGRSDLGDSDPTGDRWEGIVAAHGSMRISGRCEINGALVAEDAGRTGVDIPGHPTITHQFDWQSSLPIIPPGSYKYVFDPEFSAFEER